MGVDEQTTEQALEPDSMSSTLASRCSPFTPLIREDPIMTTVRKILATVALAGMAASVNAQTPAVKNVVLVHGAFADGSGWRGVYDELTRRGYHVTIVQNPLTSLADDVAATRRVLDRQDGPAVLVGHSWGGTVITEAGVHPNVASLVYVSALSPDVGETTGQQYTGFASTPEFVIETHKSGFGYLSPAKFKAGFPTMSATPRRRSCAIRRCRSTWRHSRAG